MYEQVPPYKPKNSVRIVTSTALFDGHDASINIMRRLMQSTGAEVIHLGHNRSVEAIVAAALQEDAQGVAITSYQGGHMEFFKYLRQRLDEMGLTHVRIFGGGGGTIVPAEIEELHEAKINRIFSPEDGRNLGLQGMINLVVEGCDFSVEGEAVTVDGAFQRLARALTLAELGKGGLAETASAKTAPVVGITGTGGAGKSSLTDELVRRFLFDFADKKVGVLCVDPTRRKTGGALLGDRIRFNSLKNQRVFMRSVATRGSSGEISASLAALIAEVRGELDLVIVETAGIGQGDSSIRDLCDVAIYVMTAEYGAPSQLEKIDMLDYADFVAINKFTRRGSEDALRDVRRQYQRNHELWSTAAEALPIFGTSAAHFNDSGVNALYGHLIAKLADKFALDWQSSFKAGPERTTQSARAILPPGRERYLSEASEACREYKRYSAEQVEAAAELEALRGALALLGYAVPVPWQELPTPVGEAPRVAAQAELVAEHNRILPRLDAHCRLLLESWQPWAASYRDEKFRYEVRGKVVEVDNYGETLSGNKVPKVALPPFRSAADRLRFRLLENVPGEFPYTSGVFPFKRQAEDPTRMFAGEGPSERTNRRFHYLADGQPAKRLSTAFDALTLYGEDPGWRPDVYGKIGESGVSIFSVEEAEQLYAGFDLCDPSTSVSMTINGPAPTILAFFFNTALRQQCRRFLRREGRLAISEAQELEPDRLRGATWEEVRALLTEEELARIEGETFKRVRGTVQADILKEDQGQNTCIFSTEFALRCMGDVQQFFTDQGVRNFYSVSISGYHIAEAGANPIHQLAFTLANGLTYVEVYRARGMKVDEFAPNLSFFFSNGMDAEYTVIGRVARRIWSVVLRDVHAANPRSQMLKYHIQTSGRSLHAMEIQFNDIRTTLQALLATYDNAQSLHTNAYDEAITTPTEESVRRAMAIQLIINKEFGMVMCENAGQGSFLVEELTDLVEEAVLRELDRISERGGVLGAMELQYQRGEIQGDSMKYEQLKHSGELPIIGVNTFLPKDMASAGIPRGIELARASKEEKESCIARLEVFQQRYKEHAPAALRRLQEQALAGGNLFAELIRATECCTLGQITHALYEVGGEYRRNL